MFDNMNDPYKLDVYPDDAHFVRLTEKNVKIVNLLISLDSAYRLAQDDDNPDNVKYLFRDKSSFLKGKDIEEIVKRIDKENATHLNSMGPKHKGDNTGIEKTVKWIKDNLDEVETKIKSKSLEDHDAIVKSIASATEVKNNFSFATKFCHYASELGLNDPNHFSIYDSIVSQMMPYYYARFCKIKLTPTDASNIKEKQEYKKYQEWIDGIIEKSFIEEKYKISRQDFDHLIWYYYKGDKRIREESLERINCFIK